MNKGVVGIVCVLLAAAAPAEEPALDSRLSVSTLVREDLFAGFLVNDLARFERGERNLVALLDQRPENKPEIIAWQASAQVYRAIRALEAGDRVAFEEHYKRSLSLFEEAARLAPKSIGVHAIQGGTSVVFSNRLPAEYQAGSWSKAWNAYNQLWEQQGKIVEKLPLHIKGELLAGLAESAYRTGRKKEASDYLDKMIGLLAGSPYESRARKWKENPDAAERVSLACQTCHDAGRLQSRRAALSK